MRGQRTEIFVSGQFGAGYCTGESPVSAGKAGDGAASVPSGVFVSAGHVHNRAELAFQLDISSPDLACLADRELMRRAWRRWGVDAPSRIFGDWSFAAWDTAAETLFLARDHTGNTTLYYHSGPRVFAFATSARALTASGFAPAEPDELFVARLLVSWPARGSGATSYAALKRLPPAHSLTVRDDQVDLREYWRPEDTPELQLRNRSEYVEAFRDVFDRAVRDRVPGEGSVGSMLSGGLDSGSVTVTAARHIAERGRRLVAYTSTPVFDAADSHPKGWFGNELPLARASADAAGNVDLRAVDSAGMSPVAGIRKTLEVALDPQHAAANLFWMLEINRAAAADGCKVLLTGQLGNAGISWPGDPFSHGIGLRIRRMGLWRWLRNSGRRLILNGPFLRVAEKNFRQKALVQTAIRPEFARRLRLIDRWAEEYAREPAPHAPRTARRRVILNGLASVNALFAEMGVAEGIAIRDPTGDPRLVAFCLSVPDRIFIDPETGLDRWLIREAMNGRLPEEVRLNRQRGFQAADLLQRLRAAPAEMDEALSEIERGRAVEYLDVPGMRKVWERVRAAADGDAQETRFLASVLLMRGVMAGLAVNRFD